MTTGGNPHAERTASDTQHAANSDGVTVIGYWRDIAEPYWPDVNDFVDRTWDTAARTAVADRLRSGRVVRQFRGHSTCRICGRPNGAAELSDGTYLWPEGLAHYIRDHQVRLPQPCETHFLTPAERAENGEGEFVDGRARGADETWWLSLGSPTWI